MSSEKFNHDEYAAGRLTDRMLVELVESYQRTHNLQVDGYAGANTQAALKKAIDGPFNGSGKVWPLALLPDGREPIITSGFYTENPSRPTHMGVDIFYKWIDTDPNVPTGDGGAIKVNGKRRWWIPLNTRAVAVHKGEIQESSPIGTGWRVWLDLGNGERAGYMHGKNNLIVKKGDVVNAGDPIIFVGHNPKVRDSAHLHFEISDWEAYRPKNPRLWLRDAKFWPAVPKISSDTVIG